MRRVSSMVLKKQTVWLLSMLTIMVVLSAYYLVQGPVEQVPVASEVKEETNTESQAEVESKQVVEQPSQSDQNVDVITQRDSDFFDKVRMDREAWDSQTLAEFREIWVNTESAEAVAEAKQSY